MASFLCPHFKFAASAVAYVPDARGPMVPTTAGMFSRQRLSTDAIGNAIVTFEGLNANSEIRVYLPDGTEAAGVELSNANHQLTWGVYTNGDPKNTVTIRVVHPQYKIKEFQYTASLGTQAIPIQQELDKWYSNPV